MLVNCASALARAAATSSSSRASYQPVSSKVVDLVVTRRSMGSKLGEAQTASHAWKKSCYNGIDYTIGDDCTVLEAIQKLAAYDVGCLVTTDANGE
jgi:predicted transcriptional regulator